MKITLETLLIVALQKKVSDIHIIKQDGINNVYFRINGILNKYTILPDDKLSNYIKYIAKIDLNFKKELSTGGFRFNVKDEIIEYRVSSIPTSRGDNLVIRVFNNKIKYELLELTPQKKSIDYLHEITQYSSGLIIISGPTGVGKSTTLHTLLNEIYNKDVKNIITIEDPIEIIEENFIQISIKDNDFNESLKQILRHDPDIVMIGEIRDENSAKLAIRCALTGCLVISTMHSNDAIRALSRLLNLELSKQDLIDVLKSIVSQRIIYGKSKNFAIYEWLDYENIIKCLNDEDYEYCDFKKNISNSIENSEFLAEDIKNFKI